MNCWDNCSVDWNATRICLSRIIDHFAFVLWGGCRDIGLVIRTASTRLRSTCRDKSTMWKFLPLYPRSVILLKKMNSTRTGNPMRSHEEPTEFFFRLTWFTCVKLRYVTLTLRLRCLHYLNRMPIFERDSFKNSNINWLLQLNWIEFMKVLLSCWWL